jgi:hypothetical protein
MNRILRLLPLVLILAAIGCKDDPASSTTNGTTTFSGTNGFVINGDSLSNVVVTADSASGTSSAIFFINSTYVKLYGHLNNEPVVVKLNVLDQGTTGTFNWTTSTGNVNVDANIEIDDSFSRGYSAVSGKTIITKLGAVGETIEGSFSGTMKNKEKPTVTVEVNGKFSAIRRE